MEESPQAFRLVGESPSRPDLVRVLVRQVLVVLRIEQVQELILLCLPMYWAERNCLAFVVLRSCLLKRRLLDLGLVLVLVLGLFC